MLCALPGWSLYLALPCVHTLLLHLHVGVRCVQPACLPASPGLPCRAGWLSTPRLYAAVPFCRGGGFFLGGVGVRVSSSRCQEGDKYSVRQLPWLCVSSLFEFERNLPTMKTCLLGHSNSTNKTKQKERERGGKKTVHRNR